MLIAISLLAIICTLAIVPLLGGLGGLASSTAASPADIAVIIPARDEEENVKNLLPTLSSAGEVIVVDDDSTDATAAVARQLGATVVPAGPLPEGWLGKPHACQRGALATDRSWLLFLDADVVVEQGGLEAIAAQKELGVLVSICPYHQTHTLWESFSLYFNVLMVAGAKDRLYGQSLLISRSDYEALGTHKTVRAEPTENLALWARAYDAGLRTQTYLGRGILSMRMFSRGIGQLSQSWSKSFAKGGKHTPKSAVIMSSIWLTGGMLVLTGAGVGALFGSSAAGWIMVATAYIAFAVSTAFAAHLVGRFSVVASVFFPVTLLGYQWIFFRSLRRGKATWKGRHVD